MPLSYSTFSPYLPWDGYISSSFPPPHKTTSCHFFFSHFATLKINKFFESHTTPVVGCQWTNMLLPPIFIFNDRSLFCIPLTSLHCDLWLLLLLIRFCFYIFFTSSHFSAFLTTRWLCIFEWNFPSLISMQIATEPLEFLEKLIFITAIVNLELFVALKAYSVF